MLRYDHGGNIYSLGDIRLDFSVNINPLGMPAPVKEAISSNIPGYESYPDPNCRALCRAIAERAGVSPEDILCGNGASELIHRLVQSQKPKKTLLLAPTFSEYERAALLFGSSIVFHRLREEEDFALTERILEDISPDIDMLFICDPNNPTGQLAGAGLIARIAGRCEETGTLLVIDECFLAFTPGCSAKALLRAHPGIAVLDAFTKLYAMAGLRLGYLITKNHELLERAREFGPCWAVSSVAQAAGLAAVACDGYVDEARALVAAERARLANALSALGLRVFPGSANYVLFKCERPLVDPLLERGIFIRSCANYEGLGESFYRVCVKKRDENMELINALSEVLRA